MGSIPPTVKHDAERVQRDVPTDRWLGGAMAVAQSTVHHVADDRPRAEAFDGDRVANELRDPRQPPGR